MIATWALASSLAAQTPTDGSDVAILVTLALFFLAFIFTGARFLQKKRKERLDALTTELEKPAVEGAPGLPALPAGDTAPVPRADDLLKAEREAVRARAAADEARRATARLDDSADAEARAAAAAKAAAAEARTTDAEARAKELRLALSKTRDGLVGRLSRAIGGKELDASVLDDVESVLFTADIGARTAERLLELVKTKLSAKELHDATKVEQALREEAVRIFAGVQVKPLAVEGTRPRVVMVLGVNGAGKTTTIGKLAAQLKGEGHKVLLGAGDTFRAAAADQLEVWAERAGCPIVTGPDGSDPSSVLFDTVKKGVAEGFDVILCDTAGRLHTKVNLMEELRKVTRSLGKACEGAPHEVILVLDGTVGQNAIQQAKQFGEAAPLTGIVITKLDGTAKGGVVLGIVDELKVPVRYIGVGEKITDLRPFDPKEFVDALFGS
jgi:fused signal recognition particle receptor